MTPKQPRKKTMSILMKFTVLGMSLMLSVWACANNDGKDSSARCDHKEPKTFNVKIIAGKDQSKPPRVDKETIVACFEDDIVFELDEDDIVFEGDKDDLGFTILFKKDSPFGQNLRSSRGKAKAKAKVTADPKDKSVAYKYGVKVPGYPELDPRIIISPR